MRASQPISRAFKQFRQTRSLHMTGPATSPSLVAASRYNTELPKDLAGLQHECRVWRLPTHGTKDELTTRLLSRIDASGTRTFGTTHGMREATSSATINFADFPDYDPDANASPILRIPMQTQFAEAESRAVPEAEEEILPTIFTVSDPSTHIHPPSAMQDVADNSAIDFQGLASKVGETVGRTKRVLQGVVDEALATKARN